MDRRPLSLGTPQKHPQPELIPLSLSRASSPLPASPDPSHARPPSAGAHRRPLLHDRSSSSSVSPQAAGVGAGYPAYPSPAGPSRSTAPAPACAPVPSRYPRCKLCALVEEVGRVSVRRNTPALPAASSPLVPHSNGTTGVSSVDDEAGPSRSAYAPPVSPRTVGRGTEVHGRKILYHDEDITVYPAEGKEKLCSDGRHLIVVINQHAESVYELGPIDVPLLSKMIDVARKLLPSPTPEGGEDTAPRIGFVGAIMRDPQSSHAHLHAHAMSGPIDTSLPGASFWRRNVVFGWSNWWSIEDLRAEIRESSSNNRVKSGYDNRPVAPIDRVPTAGARVGLPNALDPPLTNGVLSSRPAETRTGASEAPDQPPHSLDVYNPYTPSIAASAYSTANLLGNSERTL